MDVFRQHPELKEGYIMQLRDVTCFFWESAVLIIAARNVIQILVPGDTSALDEEREDDFTFASLTQYRRIQRPEEDEQEDELEVMPQEEHRSSSSGSQNSEGNRVPDFILPRYEMEEVVAQIEAQNEQQTQHSAVLTQQDLDALLENVEFDEDFAADLP